ncbi:hypothetical protein MUK42_07439 [Musa troglodytarum]|uniref:Plastid lipid-associated protein/fibrillin conserved domain-containing protein n=1 Tax=Musa troglodytarum TaxID=320322 RepID=A0A9E7KSL1_9LILI|nr:hypothetical protein MUK42_07439 [Musa troglodytarum]
MAGEAYSSLSLCLSLTVSSPFAGLTHVTCWDSCCHFRPQMAALILRPLPQTSSNFEAFPRNRLAKGTQNRPHSSRRRSASALVASASTTGATGRADGRNGNGRDGPSSAAEFGTIDDIKAALYQALTGIDKGIFGATSSKKSEVAGFVETLESRNPTPYPTDHLRDKRVDIKLERSNITPDQLMKIFEKNLDLLLAIFNPQGWLEITYVDESMRIGRDDKGNIFVLERNDDIEV